MKKNWEYESTPVCEKCGKVAPVDEEHSINGWTAYRIKEPCECGGEFTPRFLLEKEE